MMDIKAYILGTQDGGGGVTPTGNIEITDMEITDVAAYATAQVVEENLIAGNVKKDVSILGVVGTFDPQPELQDKTITQNGTYSADEGYDGLGEVTVNVEGGGKTYDLTGDISSMFTSPLALDAAGENLSAVRSFTDITDMTAAFSNPNLHYTGDHVISIDPTTKCVMERAFQNFGHNTDTNTLPTIVGKICRLPYAFYDVNVDEVDLSQTSYDGFDQYDNFETQYSIFGGTTKKIILPNPWTFNNNGGWFDNCFYLQEIEYDDIAWNRNIYWSGGSLPFRMFTYCYGLREVPQLFYDFWELDEVKEAEDAPAYGYREDFAFCYNLDEIHLPEVPPDTSGGQTEFYQTFNDCNRLKSLTFAANMSLPLSNMNINLISNVGYANDMWNKYWYAGISADKEVKSAETYAALKNDPDWWTSYPEFSRYNHDSAVETINSLPDATGGTENTIQFYGYSGSLTDGGAISTLTADEIAVAAAKGWTVSLN